MSSLGYAIVFMLCGPDAGSCEQVAVRASRFATLEQCQRTVPQALAQYHRGGRNAPVGMTASCQMLDLLCAANATLSSPRQFAASAFPLHRVSMTMRVAARDPVLDILCAPQPEPGCDG